MNDRAAFDRIEIERLRAAVAAVQALVDHARLISTGERMTVYVADVERALGQDASRPHKVGSNGSGLIDSARHSCAPPPIGVGTVTKNPVHNDQDRPHPDYSPRTRAATAPCPEESA